MDKLPLDIRIKIWQGWNELNTIRARDGVPYTHMGYKSSVSESYFDKVVEDLKQVLGDDAQPWPPNV